MDTFDKNAVNGTKVYLAGKIGANDWRHRLVPGLRDHGFEGWNDDPIHTPSFTYVGPFFIACDHSCYHGENKHGVAAGSFDLRQKAVISDADSAHLGCIEDIDVKTARDVVAKRNHAAVRSSDLVFAFITSADAFGTFGEISRAIAWGVRVVVAFPPDFDCVDDMWHALDGTTIHKDIAESQLPDLLQREVERTKLLILCGIEHGRAA